MALSLCDFVTENPPEDTREEECQNNCAFTKMKKGERCIREKKIIALMLPEVCLDPLCLHEVPLISMGLCTLLHPRI